MTPPFETSVIIDPRGAYTTAAAVVAKVEHGGKNVGMSSLKGEKVIILAGTGPVGRVTAKLFANLGCRVYITSRKKEKAEAIAKEVSDECGIKITGIQVSNQEEVYEGIKDCPIIITTGKAGVELISKETLKKLEGTRLITDINAVPPPGVAGLKPKYDLRKLLPDIYGIGALVVGDLKYRLEHEILDDAQKKEKGVFDYNYAFEKARKLLGVDSGFSFTVSELKSPRLTLSLKGKV
jgi:methylene-tetrahydromethanopterin dehydrogenase